MLPRRRPDLPTGVEQPVPYDRSQLMGQDLPPDAAPPPLGGPPMDQQAPGLGDMGGMPPPPSPLDPGMGGTDPNAPLNDMAPPPAVGGMDQMPQSPEDAQVEQMAAALEDPNIDPATRAQIEQQLSLAARRQLAGMGG